MLDTMAAQDDRLNTDAGVLVPFDRRNSEDMELDAAGLLDETGPIGMIPLALFNRLILRPRIGVIAVNTVSCMAGITHQLLIVFCSYLRRSSRIRILELVKRMSARGGVLGGFELDQRQFGKGKASACVFLSRKDGSEFDGS